MRGTPLNDFNGKLSTLLCGFVYKQIKYLYTWWECFALRWGRMPLIGGDYLYGIRLYDLLN